MKLITFAAFLFIAPALYAAEVLDLEFKDSGGKLYHTTTLTKDITSQYGQTFADIDMKVLLTQTPTSSDEKYQVQNTNLGALGHETEELQVIFITACAQQEYLHGYHTSVEPVKRLSSAKHPFRVRLLNSKGVVLKDSSSPVSTNELRRWLKHKKDKV